MQDTNPSSDDTGKYGTKKETRMGGGKRMRHLTVDALFPHAQQKMNFPAPGERDGKCPVQSGDGSLINPARTQRVKIKSGPGRNEVQSVEGKKKVVPD